MAMRLALAIVLVLLVPAPAFAHNRCDCLRPMSGPPGTLVTIGPGYTAYRVVWNGRPSRPSVPRLARLYRPNSRTIELVKLPRPRSKVRFRVPRVPPGTYPVVIYDGSEGRTHFVWTVFRVRRP